MAQHNRPTKIEAVATVATASIELEQLVADELEKAEASQDKKNATLGDLLSGRSKTRSTDESGDKDE